MVDPRKESEVKATYGFRATMTARPGKGDELINLLLSATADGSGASEHCVLYLVGRSAGNRDVVHVTEGWTTREAHADNFATDQAKAFVAPIAPLLADEPQFQDEVPVGGKFRG
jgi:quinol monooxygenase YgiN